MLIDLKSATRVFEDEGGGEVYALDNVSLRIKAGEFVCVVGPSGSGKTTLINILGCLDQPTRGAYCFAGIDVAGLDLDELATIRREHIGLVFQSSCLLERATARENVELPATYIPIEASQRRGRATELLRSLGLGDRLDHRPPELSGGENRRVSVARALMNSGGVILADEPTGALDGPQRDALLALFAELAEQGHIVVVASHDRSVAVAASRRVEIRDGRILGDSGITQRESTRALQPPQPPAQLRLAGGPWLRFTTAVRAAFASLRNAPLRSALSVLSVAIGVGCVITTTGLAESTYAQSRQFVGSMGADRISVSPSVEQVSFTAEDARAIQQQVRNVREVVPRLYDRRTVHYGNRQDVVELHADGTASLPQFMYQEYSLERGIFLTDQHDEAGEQVAVIGPLLRESLFPRDVDPIGETLVINGVPFQVIGVLARHPILHGPQYASKDSVWERIRLVFVPFRTAASLLFPLDARVSIDVYVDDPDRVEDTAKDVRDVLIRRHGQHEFSLLVHERVIGAYRDLRRQDHAVFWGIGTVALILGSLGVMASMFTSIRQRSREIALRMAVGARRRDILQQLIVESLVVTTIGAVVGALLTLTLMPVISELLQVTIVSVSWVVPTAIAVAVAVGMASGVIPAVRASKVDPTLASSTH